MSRSSSVIRLLCGALLCVPAFAAEDGEARWIETAEGCKFLVPPGARFTKLSWSGQCNDGHVHGEGTATVEDGPVSIEFVGTFQNGTLPNGKLRAAGTEYEGPMKNNTPEGEGQLRAGGYVYKGTFTAGTLGGTATMEYPDGSKYVGEVARYAPHGKGRMEHADSGVYEGEFVHGEPHGRGVRTWPDGTRYEGEYKSGARSGSGEMTWANGSRYQGEFVADHRHGQGRFTNGAGDEYVGQYLNDARHGPGKYTYADGAVSEGEWKNNDLNGKCRMVLATGVLYEGQCIRGNLSGPGGHYENPATTEVYDGEFADGRFHGQGRLVRDGALYEGQFVNGTRSGRGKETFEGGEEYEGEFARDMRNGRGVWRITGVDGKQVIYDGEFKDGGAHGQGVLTASSGKLTGEFRGYSLIKGTIETSAGRKLEIDLEQDSVIEILPDGSRKSLTQDELANIKI